jgi:hypothetical protein
VLTLYFVNFFGTVVEQRDFPTRRRALAAFKSEAAALVNAHEAGERKEVVEVCLYNDTDTLIRSSVESN